MVVGSSGGGPVPRLGASCDPAARRTAWETIRSLRTLCFQPQQRFYHERLGHNFRLTNMQAAVGLGLAHCAVKKDELRAAAQTEIDAICLGAPIAVTECKKLVRRAAEQRPVAEAFREMEEWSRRMFTSPDGQEGMASFREKRKPKWVRQ